LTKVVVKTDFIRLAFASPLQTWLKNKIENASLFWIHKSKWFMKIQMGAFTKNIKQ